MRKITMKKTVVKREMAKGKAMKGETIKKAAAVILAGAMCFGLVWVSQNVTAKQNICSDTDGIKDSSDCQRE